MMKKSDMTILICAAVLIFLYALSFVREGRLSQGKRDAVKTALINPRNVPGIRCILLSGEEGTAVLLKEGSIWTVSREGESEIRLPADSSRIENFLADFSKVRNLYKISDEITPKNSFGLTGSSVFSVRYYYSDGKDEHFEDLFFGERDFSLSMRYLMSGRSAAVYEMGDELQKYLSLSVQFWAEPFLISRAASGISALGDVQRITVSGDASGGGLAREVLPDQRLLELRHGGLPSAEEVSAAESGVPSLTLSVEVGNRASVFMSVFPCGDDDAGYVVVSSYYGYGGVSSPMTFRSKISGWTYSRIKEITL